MNPGNSREMFGKFQIRETGKSRNVWPNPGNREISSGKLEQKNRETGKPYWVPKPQMMENSERTSKHFQKPRNIIRFKLWGGTILGK